MSCRIEKTIEVSKIVSVNNYMMRFSLTPEVRKAKEEYLLKIGRIEIPNWEKIRLTLGFYFAKNYLKRDLSNCIKIFEDCLFKAVGKNDAIVTDLIAFKRKGEKERIYFCIEASE